MRDITAAYDGYEFMKDIMLWPSPHLIEEKLISKLQSLS